MQEKARLWAKKLGKCPGVAAIFLSGSLAQDRGNDQSDIDFFVIARPGQIWTARFFVFITLKLNKQLAKPHDHVGKICPNHFITSDHLKIVEKNAYSAHLFSHNQPLYDPYNLFPKFVEKNQWVQDFNETFPQVGADYIGPQDFLRAGDIPPLRRLIEQLLKKIQIFIVKGNPEYQTSGASIVLTDTELRFHPVPRSKNWHKKPR